VGVCILGREVEPIAFIDLPGAGMDRWIQGAPENHSVPPEWSERFSRDIAAFGGIGALRRFQSCRFSLIGVGRTGSLIAEGLDSKEPGALHLVDPDVLESHNVTGMFVSRSGELRSPKVDAVRSALRAIGSTTPVDVTQSTGLAGDAHDALSSSDVIISAVDHNAGRLEAALISALFLRVHLDVGTGIVRENGRLRAGYDVRLVVPGDGCLVCLGGLPNVNRPRPDNFREEREGSSRSLNTQATGQGLRLLERLFAGMIHRSTWVRYEEREDGNDTLTVMDVPRMHDCPLCALAGLGELAEIR
jgi:hypothetical protein